MLTSLATQSATPSPASREAAFPTYRDQPTAARSHVFATPVVREIRRPAPEPLSFAATW